MYRPRLDLFVFAVPDDGDPMELLRIWGDFPRREPPMALRESFPLVANPPPDTLLMRATGLDLSVFGEPLGDGALQMIGYDAVSEYGHHETLARMLGEGRADTVDTLVGFARRHAVPCDAAAIEEALQTGRWPTRPDAMLQVAAFAHVLGRALQVAAAHEQSVVWAYRQTELSYDYPQPPAR